MQFIADCCPSCGERNLQRSRWRLVDLLALFQFLRPLRCHTCSERFYVPLFARQSPPEKDGVVVRIRLKHPPGIMLRALLWFISAPSKHA